MENLTERSYSDPHTVNSGIFTDIKVTAPIY